MTANLIAFIVAFGASLVLVPLAARVARRLGILDQPGPRKVHAEPTPLLGGLAIFCSAALALSISLQGVVWPRAGGIFAAAILLLVVGTLDDVGLLHPQVKLMVAMPVAGVILFASGTRVSLPLAGDTVSFFLTVLWVVGITAAFSILDHLDGLCAGVAAVALGFFIVLANLGGRSGAAIFAAAVLGAALGFLRWNFSRAKIFMGDGGAMFLGLALAALALEANFARLPWWTGWMIPVLILGVPICDTALVIISRARRGLIPFAAAGKDHAAHRLVNLGLGSRQAAVAMYGVGALFGTLGLVVRQLASGMGYVVGALVAAAAAAAIAFLLRVPVEMSGAGGSASLGSGAGGSPAASPLGFSPRTSRGHADDPED